MCLGQWDTPGVLALIVSRIHAAQDKLSTLFARLIAIQPEGKDWLRDNALGDHVDERWHRPPNRYSWKSKSLDASQTWLRVVN